MARYAIPGLLWDNFGRKCTICAKQDNYYWEDPKNGLGNGLRIVCYDCYLNTHKRQGQLFCKRVTYSPAY